MFRQVFNPDNLLWRIIASGVDFVGLSLFWALLSLPIVTVGPATAALYFAVVKVFRQGADDGFTQMWNSFKANLKTGILLTLICIPVIFLIFYGYSVMYANAGSDVGAVMFVIYYILLILPVGWMSYLFPMLGRFSMSGKELAIQAAILAIRHLPTTFILVLLNVQLILAVIQREAFLVVVPVGGMLLSSIFLEQIFMKYLDREQQAAMRGMTLEELEYEEARKEEKKRAKNKKR